MDLIIENHQKVEILPLLKKRYTNEIREDIVSVKFVTNQDGAAVEFIYSYDLCTIISDGMALGADELKDSKGKSILDKNNKPMLRDYFDIGNSVIYNAKKFIFELDEYSKLMMVGENLFTQSYIDKIIEENF
jgi:hypothetical protein